MSGEANEMDQVEEHSRGFNYGQQDLAEVDDGQ